MTRPRVKFPLFLCNSFLSPSMMVEDKNGCECFSDDANELWRVYTAPTCWLLKLAPPPYHPKEKVHETKFKNIKVFPSSFQSFVCYNQKKNTHTHTPPGKPVSHYDNTTHSSHVKKHLNIVARLWTDCQKMEGNHRSETVQRSVFYKYTVAEA